VRGPGSAAIEWDAEITAERPGDLSSWRSLDGAYVHNEGRIEFRDAPLGRGTEMRVVVTYEPPAGALGRLVAKTTGDDPKRYFCEALRRFTQLSKTGEGLLSAEEDDQDRDKRGRPEPRRPVFNRQRRRSGSPVEPEQR